MSELARLREVAEAATPERLGALRKVGRGQRRRPETTAFFEQVADALPNILALLDRLEAAEAKVRRVEALAGRWERMAAQDRDRESQTLRAVVAYLQHALADPQPADGPEDPA